MSQPPDVGALRLEDEYDEIPYQEGDIDYDMDIDLGPTPSKPSAPRPESAESRETTLRRELDNVRQINKVIEDVVQSLEKAKGNMDVRHASTFHIFNTLTRRRTSTARCIPLPLSSTHGRAFSPRRSTINVSF